MWSTSARSAVLALALALCGGCGARALDVVLAIDPSCSASVHVPAGGSIQVEVSIGDPDAPDGGTRQFCGGCLASPTAVDGNDALLAFLRKNAPPCAGVAPGSTLLVRVTGWSGAGCPTGNPPLLCATSPAVVAPDGRSDGQLPATLSCPASCTGCVPTTCAAKNLDCDFISDGCGMLLDCGTCRPPLKCGGAGTPNVCGK